MTTETKLIKEDTATSQHSNGEGWPWSSSLRCPGLTPNFQEIEALADDLPKRLAVFSYKEIMSDTWVVFAGGTGTGKSTLFNAFCGKSLSETGVERPKTFGPIAYAHQDSPIQKGFPFPSWEIEQQTAQNPGEGPAAGRAGHILVLEHDREDWSDILVVDTPDLDSVEAENRQITEDLYLLSDVVVFVTSQEKYADEVPYQFLTRVVAEEKPYFLLINKTQDPLTREEVALALKTQGIVLKQDRVWLIPYTGGHPAQSLSEEAAFSDFVRSVLEQLAAEGMKALRWSQRLRRAEDLEERVGRLAELLEDESHSAREWLKELEGLYKDICLDLVRAEKRRFKEESREYLRREIRKLFSKYDLLAKPRRYIREILLTPLRLLGLYQEKTKDAHRNALNEIRKKIDLTPIQAAVQRFNRLVLEELCPADETSPLSRELRKKGVTLDEEEIKEIIWKEQDRLDAWLEETFEDLALSIPKGKKWGIYSTSILWGILILCFEIIVGGGFTVLDAALDSALAPFVTKGAVELFAYHEIQRIARELAKRYQQGLLSVVDHQRNRYAECLQSLLTPQESVGALEALSFETRKQVTTSVQSSEVHGSRFESDEA